MALGRSQAKFRPLTPATAASTGITLTSTTDLRLVKGFYVDWDGLDRYRVEIELNPFSFTTTAAAKALGQKLCTLPEGWIRPRGGWVKMTSTTGAATAATAGEVGLGGTIGTGAVAVLGGTVGFENFMEGTTISNHVAETLLSTNKANDSVVAGTQGATAPNTLDGTATPIAVHFNIASTFDATGGITINSLLCGFDFEWIRDV